MAADIRQRWIIDGSGAVKSLKEIKEQGADSLRSIEKAGADAAKTIVDMGKKAALTAAALGVALGGYALKAGAEFEAQLNRVNLALGDRSAATAFKGGLAEVGKQLVILSSDVGDLHGNTAALQALLKLGIDPNKSMALVEQSAKLAEIGMGKAEDAAVGLAAALKAYNLDASQSAQVSDVFAHILGNTNAKLGDVTGSLGPLLPLAAKLGISLNEVGAAFVTMAKQTGSAEAAGSQLKAVIIGLESAHGKLAKAGIDVNKVISEQGLSGALATLQKVTGGAADGLNELGLGGKKLAGVMALTGEGAAQFRGELEKIGQSSGALDKLFGKINTGVLDSWGDLKSAITGTLALLGQSPAGGLAPYLDSLRDKVIGLVKDGSIERWGKQAGEALTKVADAVQSFGGFLVRHEGSILLFGTALATVFAVNTVASWAIAGGKALAGMAISLAVVADGAVAAGSGLAVVAGSAAAAQLAFAAAAVVGLALAKVFSLLEQGQHAQVDAIRKTSEASKDYARVTRIIADQTGEYVGDIREQYKSLADVQAAAATGYVEKASKAIAALDAEKAATKSVGVAVVDLGKEKEVVTEKVRTFSHAVGLSEKELAKAAKEAAKHEKAEKQLADQIEKTGLTFVQFEREVGKLRAAMDPAIIENLIAPLKAAEALRNELGTGSDAVAQYALDMGALNTVLGEVGTETGPKTKQQIAELADRVDDAADAAERLGKPLSSLPPLVQEAFKENRVRDFTGAMLDGIQGATSLGDVLGSIGKGLASTLASGGGFKDFFSGIKKQFSTEGMTSGQRFGGAAQAAFSQLADKSKPLGTRIGGAVGAGIGGAFLGPAGALLGGKIGGLIGGLFSKKSAWEKAEKGIKENVAAAMESGTEAGLAKAGAALAKGLAIVAKGGKDAKAALKGVSEGYLTLLDGAEKAGTSGTRAFGSLVAGAKALSKEVPEIAAWFQRAAEAGTEAFGKLLLNARVNGAGTLEALGQIASNAITIFAGLGNSRAALEKLGPGLDSIIEKAKAAGKEIPAAIAMLVADRAFFEQNKDTYDSIDALVTITKEWGKAGFISTEGFIGLQQQAVAMNTQLIEAGRGSAAALKDTAPILQEIINEHNRNGKAIDASTLGLINQAAALGLVKVAGTDAFAAARAESTFLLGGMAAIFGKEGKLAGYLKETGQRTAETVGGMTQTFQQGFQGIASAAQTGLGAIQKTHADIAGVVAGTAKTVVDSTLALVADAGSRVSGYAAGIEERLGQVRRAKGFIDDEFGDERNRGGRGKQFAGGGYTGDKSGIAGVVHGREFVFDQASTAAIGPGNLAAMMANAVGSARQSAPTAAAAPVAVAAAPSAPSTLVAYLQMPDGSWLRLLAGPLQQLFDAGALTISAEQVT